MYQTQASVSLAIIWTVKFIYSQEKEKLFQLEDSAGARTDFHRDLVWK